MYVLDFFKKLDFDAREGGMRNGDNKLIERISV